MTTVEIITETLREAGQRTAKMLGKRYAGYVFKSEELTRCGACGIIEHYKVDTDTGLTLYVDFNTRTNSVIDYFWE